MTQLRKILHLTIIIIFLFSIYCKGQNGFKSLSTSSAKAERIFRKAILYYESNKFLQAETELKKAISTDINFAEAYLLLGDIYHYLNKEDLAQKNYSIADSLRPGFYPKINFIKANLYYNNGNYIAAKKEYEKYLSFERDMLSEAYIKSRKNLDNCDFAIFSMQNPPEINPVNLGDSINSPLSEYFPSITVDNQTILFTRRDKDDNSPSGYNENFYVSIKKNNEWGAAINLSKPVNTAFNEGAPSLSADGNILIFTSCEIFGKYGENRDGYGSCDLFFTRKVGDSWTKPFNIGKPINSANWETQPSYSADGRTLYFIRGSFNKDHSKNQDIWYSVVGDNGFWQNPVKLSNKINTQNTEESVFIHPDGQTMYFSSDGHTGMGGMDIFVSRRDSTGEWGDPVNLGYPINSKDDENSFMVGPDGKTAYFASDRKGGKGELDIYSIELPVQYRANTVSYIKGKIFNKENKQPIYARFELIDLKTGKTYIKTNSNKGNGEFLLCLPLNRNYALNVSANGYLFYSDNINVLQLKEMNSLSVDIALTPVKEGETVVLKNIFFDTDKAELKSESLVELNKLSDLLTKNPGLSIEISGHTDSEGDDSHNQLLSENRAKAVYDFLLTKNIAKERLLYKGYGESKPIDNNGTDKGKANNRRTEFKVVKITK